jgi:hypothetical protein
MFSIGNINPLSIMVGSSNPINAINMANIWEEARLEINKPRERAVMIKRILSA